MALDVTTQVFVPATAEEWTAQLLANAATLKLPVTSWQPGGAARTTQAVVARALMLEDVATSVISQGGFLDYAASGTVTYADPQTGASVTVYVSPDPSNPEQNPDGDLTWLDVLAISVYDEERTLSTFAGGQLAIVNTSVSTYGPFVAGTYHVADPYGAVPSYNNQAALSIPPSAILGTSILDAANDGAGLIEITTSAVHGLTTGDAVGIQGVLGVTPLTSPTCWYCTVTSTTTFTLDGSVFAGAYVSGGFVYAPTVAGFEADATGSGGNSVDGSGVPALHTVTSPITPLVGVTTDNLEPFIGTDIETNLELAAKCRLKLSSLSPNGPKGAYEYFALNAARFGALLLPVVTISASITRVLVVPSAETGDVAVYLATSLGAPSGPDVTAVDAIYQAYCVPDSITTVAAATATKAIVVAVTVWVPSNFATIVIPVAQAAVQNYFAALKIGGLTITGDTAPATNVVPVDAVRGAVFTACAVSNIPIQDCTVLLDGFELNIQLALTPVPEVATISGVVPSVAVVSVAP